MSTKTKLSFILQHYRYFEMTITIEETQSTFSF